MQTLSQNQRNDKQVMVESLILEEDILMIFELNQTNTHHVTKYLYLWGVRHKSL